MNTAGSYVSLSLWELVSINPVTCSARWLAFMSYLGIYIILRRIEEKKKKIILPSLANLRGTLIKKGGLCLLSSEGLNTHF